jgi:hypothetical protein
MVKLKLKLLYIIISFLIFKPVLAEESWYQTAANQKAKHKHLVEGMTVFLIIWLWPIQRKNLRQYY